MRITGLTEHVAAVTGRAELELPYGGKTYRAPQPGLVRGLRCTQYLAAETAEQKLAVLAEAGKDSPDATVENLSDLTLTRAVVNEMDADDVPITVVVTLAHVALVAWVRGPEVAERYVAGLIEGDGGEAPSGEARSGSRSRKKTGTATASEKRTRKPASSTTTASRPAS